MAHVIEVTEQGTNRQLSVIVSNILFFEAVKNIADVEVTVLTLIDKSKILVNEHEADLRDWINSY